MQKGLLGGVEILFLDFLSNHLLNILDSKLYLWIHSVITCTVLSKQNTCKKCPDTEGSLEINRRSICTLPQKGGSDGLLYFLFFLLCQLGLLFCQSIPTVCSKASEGVVTSNWKVWIRICSTAYIVKWVTTTKELARMTVFNLRI